MFAEIAVSELVSSSTYGPHLPVEIYQSTQDEFVMVEDIQLCKSSKDDRIALFHNNRCVGMLSRTFKLHRISRLSKAWTISFS